MPREETTIRFYLLGHHTGIAHFSNDKDLNRFLNAINYDLVHFSIAKGNFSERDFPAGAVTYKGPHADHYE